MKGVPNEIAEAKHDPRAMTFRRGEIIVRNDSTYPQGALVVDGYDDAGNLLSHPMGGGPQFLISQSDVARFVVADSWERTPIFRRARFSIEGVGEEFVGWSHGHMWNGWATPRFELAEAEKVVHALDPNSGRYNAAADSFVTTTGDSDEEVWPGETIALPDGGMAKVYPVGAGSWIWDETKLGDASS